MTMQIKAGIAKLHLNRQANKKIMNNIICKIVSLESESGIIENIQKKKSHLYFITQQSISIGDWVYAIPIDRENYVAKANVTERVGGYEEFLKIVATTDPSLELPLIPMIPKAWLKVMYLPYQNKINMVSIEKTQPVEKWDGVCNSYSPEKIKVSDDGYVTVLNAWSDKDTLLKEEQKEEKTWTDEDMLSAFRAGEDNKKVTNVEMGKATVGSTVRMGMSPDCWLWEYKKKNKQNTSK